MAYQPTNWEHGDIITGGKLNKIEQELTHVADNATYGFGGAVLSSDGLTPLNYINAGDPMPSNPQKGDTVFLKDGNDFLIYSYNGEDWVLKVDPDLSNRIEETIKTASDNTDKAIADNNTQINETINQVAKEQAGLAVKDGDFNNKAQAMADKALSDAKANTATVAKSTLDTANQNIADAKKSVSDDIAKEASDRATAVSALDTKAQGYADTAKKNAIDVATSADGVISKKIDDTASSITSTVSQNKKDADGKISTAQSTATQALNGLSSKVDTSTYNAKTGQLSTDVTNVTQTANQAKTDIASIKQTDTSQDARMTTIEADASGTKTIVSNLQTVQGQQTGSISALQQRADGFDATVTKVNNLSVGTRNYWSLSNKLDTQYIDLDGAIHTSGSGLTAYNPNYFDVKPGNTIVVSILDTDPSAPTVLAGRIAYYDSNKSFISVSANIPITKGVYKFIVPSNAYYFRVSLFKYIDIRIKVEIGTIATDWTPAPEDVDNATAKAQLTADQATTSLNNYKTDADGRITKAQSDITQTAKDVTTKVSQTDYNTKTGDLDTRVTKAQTTADGAVTTVGAYKTSNDNRVKATETSIAQNTKDITLRATTADLDSAKKDYNAQIAQVNINANAITSQVSNVNSKIDNLAVGGRNYFITSTATKGYLADNGAIGPATNHDLTSDFISVSPNDTWIATGRYNSNASSSPEMVIVFQYYDANKAVVGARSRNTSGKYVTQYSVTKTIPSGVAYMRVSAGWVNDGYGSFKIEKGNTVTDWSPAPEDVDNKISAQQITINGITDTVSKQGANIDSVTKRVTTAEGTLSIATDNISGLQTKQTQTANQITQEISDRTKGDSNTLQSSKDFTTSSITSAVNGVNSTITQTSDSLIAKINTKTDSDTVLSLFKDNWSIGITDNISKITSGIVGNASQMSLISKNVTIDAPSTQIKGTAWINSAMIANGAIGSAQIGDATITSAKIATLDVAKLTGDTSTFIQSNWNGSYGSTQITDTGMTVTSKSPKSDLSIRSVFDANGLTMYTPKGATAIRDGQTAYISSSNEDIGMMGTVKWAPHPNVDYLMVGLHGYHTTTPGDSNYDQNSDNSNVIYGGDGIGFGISNANGGYDMLMTWDSPLVAGYQGRMSGWHVEDVFTTHLMSYAAGGLKVSSQYSEGERSLHTGGITINNNSKWFGFLDGSENVGFGTDQTQDVIVFIKGKPYSMYTMLNKLGMLK